MKKHRLSAVFCAAVLLLSQAVPTFASGANVTHEFYVAPNGSDAAKGTLEAPFKTAARAQQAVREVNQNMRGDIKVYFREGTYYLPETLSFTEADSGTNGYYVSYEAYHDEAVTISGGREISGWQKLSDDSGLWAAPFDEAPYVVTMDINGRPGRRAQSEDVGRVLRHWDDTSDDRYKVDGFFTNADDLSPDLRNLTDVQLHLVYMWRNYLYNVDAVVENPDNPKENLVKIGRQIGQEYDEITTQTHDPINWGYWIENCFEELDVPGEFYFDRQEKKIYYLPREGENMKTATVVVPVLEQLMNLEGASSRDKLTGLRFSGLSFMHSAWFDRSRYGFHTGQTQDFYAQPEMLSYPTIIGKFFVPSAISLRMTDGVRFENNTFRGIEQVGIGIYSGGYNTLVNGNVFYEMGDCAVTVGTSEAYESTPVSGCNLAEGRPVTESGSPYDNQQRYAQYLGASSAVDPNKKTAWAPRDAAKVAPWWQVDLEGEYEIDRIEIDARPDVNQELTRRSFEILASNDPTFATYTVLGSQGAAAFPHASTRVWLVDDDTHYRYVRIQKTAKEYFWLNEVRIINESMEFTPRYQFPRYTTISNNYITRVAELNWGSPGVHGYFTEGCNITHNEIWDLPYSAVCMGWGWNNYLDMTACRDNRINYNKLHDAMQRCLDGGGIYTLGRQPNSTQIGNHTYNMPNPLGAFYTDTGTSYYTFRDNVIENTGMDYNTGGPTYSIGNLVTHNFSSSAEASTVNLQGVAKDGITEQPIRFVPYNYPLEAISIVENAGPLQAYWHLRDTIPEKMFEQPEWSMYDNGVHVSNHGSMNDDRFLNWYLKMHLTNAQKLLQMAQDEMKAGESVYGSEAMEALQAAIDDGKSVAAVRPIDRELVRDAAIVVRKAIMTLGLSRELKPYDELYRTVSAALADTKIGTGVGNSTQADYTALESALQYTPEAYQKLDSERQRLANLKLEKSYDAFLKAKVSLNIQSFNFGDEAQLGKTEIDTENKVIRVHLLYAAGTSLTPKEITLSKQVKISPAISAQQDFSQPVTYTVSTLDGSATAQWTVVTTREEVTSSNGEYALDEVLADEMNWMQVGNRSSHYSGKNFGDITYTFKMRMNAKIEGDWPGIVFRNQYSNKEFLDKGTSCYVLLLSDGKLEFHRFNNGTRTQFYGPVASVPQILGPSLDCPSFRYGEDNLIKLTVRNEGAGVRIILNINGTEAMNVLDDKEGAILSPGYFGTVAPNTPVILKGVN